MEQLVGAVRGAGAKNVVLLGGLAWSNNLDGWLNNVPKDPLSNLGAVWHSYDWNGCNQESCWESTIKPILQQFPLVTTESGFKTAFAVPLWKWLESNGASYLAWAWNTWGNGQNLVTDYEPGTPSSDWGKAWKAQLSSVPAPGPGPAPGPSSPTPSPPTPGPAPSGCPGGSLEACMGLCPSSPAPAYQACIKECATRCS